MTTDIEAKAVNTNTHHDDISVCRLSVVPVGRENLAEALPPHESYEGRHRWDPTFSWEPSEERKLVRKTDLYLLTWLCVMVSAQSLSNI